MAPWPCTHATAQQQPNNPTTARAAGDGRRSRQCCLRQWAISWPRSGQSGRAAVAGREAAVAAEGREVAMQPRGRREAAEQSEAAGGGHCRRPAAAKLWLWAATVSAAAAAISGHSRFSSLALVFLVSLALWEGPSQGDVLPFSIVRAPPPHAFASIDAFRSCAVHICTLCLFHRRRWWWLWGLWGAPRGGAAAPLRPTSLASNY